jgi:hypothetical protein
MLFGNPENFAVEIYHEPAAPERKGFGRMCINVDGTTLGNIAEAHVSLFHAVERILELSEGLHDQWHERFAGYTPEEVFSWLDAVLYTGELADPNDQAIKFDFLTNAGEQFDGFKSFIYCTPGGIVYVLFQDRHSRLFTPCCQSNEFRSVASQLQQWFIS